MTISRALLCCIAILVFYWANSVAAKSQKNVLEVLAVVDKPARERWTSLADGDAQFKEELYSTFVEVNEVFKSLSNHGVHLEIRVQDLLTPGRNMMGKRSTGKVDADTAMRKLQKWVSRQGRDFDHVVVFIEAELKVGTRDPPYIISGYTMVNGTCEGYSVTIVKANYDYGTATTLTRLLAQSLMVDNDGQGKAAGCPADDGYVMTSSSQRNKSPNRWYFSLCSAEQIDSYIKQEDRRCLRETTAPSLASHKRFGEVVEANEVCKRHTGQPLVDGYEHDICEQLHCLDKIEGNTWYMSLVQTPEGISCGHRKKCIKGNCAR